MAAKRCEGAGDRQVVEILHVRFVCVLLGNDAQAWSSVLLAVSGLRRRHSHLQIRYFTVSC
jgi:hypothetical protein